MNYIDKRLVGRWRWSPTGVGDFLQDKDKLKREEKQMKETGSKFQKRQTQREVEIGAQVFLVDFGRDEIPFIFQQVAEEITKPMEKKVGKMSQEEKFAGIMEKQKEIFKDAIDRVIGVVGASKEIFETDDTAIFHSDLYGFLVSLYQAVMLAESPYSPERLK